MKVKVISAILLTYLALGLASKVNNYDNNYENSKKTGVDDAESPPDNLIDRGNRGVQGNQQGAPKIDPNHPALNPGFPYIWPYLNTPYYHPYYWPAYLYHGQYTPQVPKDEADKLKNSKKMPYMETLVFVGKFAGTCKAYPNGLYYIDNRSFAYCSNGINTVQNCPEGAENPALSEFYKGLYRFVHDFCSVNLLVNKVPIHPEAFLQRLTGRKTEETKKH